MWTIFSVIGALTISACCSISEAVFYSYPRNTAEHLASKGAWGSRFMLDIKNNMEHYIASVLIVNTLANTFAVSMATRLAAQHLSPTQQMILPWVMTVFILLFGEIVPKTVGVKQNRVLGPFVALVFFYLTKILNFTGLIWLSVRLTSRLTGEKNQEYPRDDIISLAELSKDDGIIDPQQAEIVKNAVNLKSVSARSIMTPRQVAFTLNGNASIKESLEINNQWPFSRIPIYLEKEDEWVGLILRREVFNALLEGKGDQALRKFMRPLKMIPDSMSVASLLQKLLNQRTHIMGVVDEYCSMAGIATLEDVLETLLGSEIIDEFDEAVDLQEEARKRSIALAAIKLNSRE